MPLSRAAAVVNACGLEDAADARRSRERIAVAQRTEAKKISLPSLPRTLRLHKGSLDATAHRLAQARSNGEIIGKWGEARHLSSPFATLAKKQFLNPGDTKSAQALNDALFAAGQRYHENFERAHMGVLRSYNLEPIVARSTAPVVMNFGDVAMTCRARVEDARAIIGPRLIRLVDEIILEGRTLTEVAPKYGTSSDRHYAQVEVRVMLVEALHMLVRAWGMYPYPVGEAA